MTTESIPATDVLQIADESTLGEVTMHPLAARYGVRVPLFDNRLPLVGITGHSRAGKDEVAGVLRRHDPPWQRRGFSEVMKEHCYLDLCVGDAETRGNLTRSVARDTDDFLCMELWSLIGQRMGRYGVFARAFHEAISAHSSWASTLMRGWRGLRLTLADSDFDDLPTWLDYVEAHKNVAPGQPGDWMRSLLQGYGEFHRQMVDPLYWVTRVPLVRGNCIPSIRFPAEAQALRDAGGVLWRVVRPGTGGLSHVSETAMGQIVPDLTIVNDRTLRTLRARTRQAITRLLWEDQRTHTASSLAAPDVEA